MAVPFSNTKLRVPQGFEGLLEGLVREILLTQPNDIYGFAAMYFESLLEIREGGGDDPASRVLKFKDRFYNNRAFQKSDSEDTELPVQAAVAIQTKYRQYQAKSSVDDKRKEYAAVKIQAVARGYLARQKVKHIKSQMDCTRKEYVGTDDEMDDDVDRELQELVDGDEVPAPTNPFSYDKPKSTEAAETEPLAAEVDVKKDIELDNADVQKDIAVIQASFGSALTTLAASVQSIDDKTADKQHQTDNAAGSVSEDGMQPLDDLFGDDEDSIKQSLSDEVEHGREPADAVDEDREDPNLTLVNEAVTTIQAGFRGMKVRRELVSRESHDGKDIPKDVQ